VKAGLCRPGNRSVVPSSKPLFFMATAARRCKSAHRGIGRINLEAEFDSEPVRFGSRSEPGVAMSRERRFL
jgi:hypothetical protein